jgi:hypothetical protein
MLKTWQSRTDLLAGHLPRPLGWEIGGSFSHTSYFERSSQEVLVSSQHGRRIPNLFALTLAIVFAALMVKAMDASESQTPDKGSSSEAKASSTDAERAQLLSRIFDAWRARQERVKSFHFSWDNRITLPSGYVFPSAFVDTPVVGGLDDGGAKMGAEAVEFTIPRSELWVEGKDRIRDDYFEVACKGTKDWPQTARIRKIVDAKKISRLETPVAAGKSPHLAVWRQANVNNQSAFERWDTNRRVDPQTFDWEPLCLAFRALDPVLGWAPENCRIVNENAMVDGVRCVQIQMDTLDHSELCSVDPNRDDIVVRWERRRGRSKPLSVDITYQHSKDQGWIPSSWKRQFPGQQPDSTGTVESKVTHFTINEKFAEDTFAHSSPAGSQVCDVSADGLMPVGKTAVAAPSMDAIVAAWTKRQEKAKSVKFTWHEEQVGSKGEKTEGTHTALIDGGRFAYVADNDPYPPDVASLLIKSELGNAGNKESRRQPAPGTDVSPARRAFDGTTTRTYRSINHPELTGIGSTRRGFHIDEAQGPALEPVLLMFRPFDANLGRFKAADYVVSPMSGKIGDVSCVIIESSEAVGGIRTFYWLDPARDYIVLRKQQTQNGRDHERMDISYRNDPAAGWIPDGCHESSISEVGRSCRSANSRITAFSVNQPIPAAEFLVDFPKGTKVRAAQAQATPGPARLAGGQGGPSTPRRASRGPRQEPPTKPLFDPFTDAIADIEGAVKAAAGSQKKVLIVFGNNALPASLSLYPILKEDAEVSPIVNKGFVLVLVDLHSVSGEKAVAKYVDANRRIVDPHVGILDSNGDMLQFQPIGWFYGEETRSYDPHRIKRLISYYLQPSK